MTGERRPEVRVRRLGEPGDLGWVVMAHGEIYAAEYGWDTSFEALVARIVADYTTSDCAAGDQATGDGATGDQAAGDGAAGGPATGGQARAAAWIAEADGRRVGCVFCVPADEAVYENTAQLRILLVDPAARGLGLGSRLVAACLDFARAAGYTRIRLWTQDTLASARRIYLAHGFTLASQEPHHSFGADLVGQVYVAEVTASSTSGVPVESAR